MMLISEFGRKAPNRLFFALILGSLAGICYAFLIPIVLSTLGGQDDGLSPVSEERYTFLSIEIANHKMAAVFLALCVIIVLARTASRTILMRISAELTLNLRIKLYQKISGADLRNLEGVGHSRIITAMTEDVRRVVLGGQLLPDLLMSSVTLLGMLTFLALLNTAVFVFVVQAICVGVLMHQLPVFFGNRSFSRSRAILGKLQSAMTGLVYGAKELKLNSEGLKYYMENVVLAHERDLLKADRTTYTFLVAANSYGDLLSFFVIGVVSFIFVNYHAISSTELVGVVMALLYVAGPVAMIIDVTFPIIMGKNALRQLEQLFGELSEDRSLEGVEPAGPWQCMELSNIVFQHESQVHGEIYKVGPVSLSVRRGNLTFIVGGNGSGKTTLCKMISLHYSPLSGSISFDGRAVDDSSREGFRQEISAIYSDYHLFEQLLAPMTEHIHERARGYLSMLGLENKVTINDGVFSTLALSDGQRKRLALLVALLQDRSLYIFDEWAADQDPGFKEVFYRRVLPLLRAEGKAVVVISHDDRYFDVADQIVVMEDGSLVDFQTVGSDHKGRTKTSPGVVLGERS
ncbi:cyclic peptide transporter [Pseudomonas asplenii]|uniref:Cyclic peptide transporter n=1 Tax=Pseudomonas asplenii TaxID=53407 RepID=A0A0M9GFZ8_9PSED|nr:cyclic peptide export ABC transporter [Pseudomonas fuscovaginae]KPA90314.1 cyclic peptide transporter [Pseudomonas fuscovaginae]